MMNAERNSVCEGWIDAHKAILFKVARVYGTTHSDREDLFQEIAPQLWHSVEAWRGDCEVTTWIYRVALNAALAWRRKEAGTPGPAGHRGCHGSAHRAFQP
jgi:RNA polymerase sigma-70 factor (ECF subfamily)